MLFVRMKPVLCALAMTTSSLMALSAAPAHAVSFPTDGSAFRIQLDDDPTLCLTTERRTGASGNGRLLATRACDASRNQQFTYEADTGFLHNASRPDDQCLTGFVFGVGMGFRMAPCTDEPTHPLRPRKFVPTEDSRLYITATPEPGQKPATGCVTSSREGGLAVLQKCADLPAMTFNLVSPAQ
ncbi:RICIN domain-containing protein [Streptomyces sp. NPDC012617]|uniref:RICIN domain-containing protein n=1 Tax=Streptomyces TaxID=1883 RepID=UPI0033CAFDE8